MNKFCVHLNSDDFIIQLPNTVSNPRSGERGKPTLKALADWLRQNGFDVRNPVHTLRKAYGALVATNHGLYAAKEYLGHSTIKVTEQHYAALLDRPTVDLFAEVPEEKTATGKSRAA